MTSKVAAVEPKTVKGGPVVVKFEPPQVQPKKRGMKPKLEPEQQEEKQDLLSAKDFVERYRNEAKTASWDPKILRKCGRGAEQILMTLGAHQHKESVPMREQARRKKLHEDKAELEGLNHRKEFKVKKKTKVAKKK